MPVRLICAVFVLLLSSTVFAQPQQTPEQRELAQYIRDNYDKREVMVPMRDGVKLFTAIYTPKNRTDKFPILLNRTPY